MEIRVQVETEDLSTEKRQQALSAYFIYVALDKAGKPKEVLPLLKKHSESSKRGKRGTRKERSA